MAGEWRTMTLSEANVTLIDCDHRTPPSTDAGYPYVAIPQLREGRIDFSDARRISAEHFSDWTRKAKPSENDVVLSRRCNPGESAVVPRGAEFALGQNLVLLRTDGTKVHPPFLRWLVRGPEWWGQVRKFLNVGAVFDSLKCADVPNFELRIPPVAEQRAIAHILGTLDDKIELNRRMSETLEAMARALFDSRLTCAGSQVGNWPERSLGDICTRVAMGPFGSDIKTDNFVSDGVPVIRGGNLRGGFVDEAFVYLTEAKAEELRNAAAHRGDIVVTHRGTLGQVGLIPMASRYERYIVSQSQMVLAVDRERATPRFVYEFLRSARGQHALLANTSQTGVPAIARPTTSLKAIRLPLPPLQTLMEFDRLATPLFERAEHAKGEARILSALRDLLLPKLISGELRVNDVDRIPAAAL